MQLLQILHSQEPSDEDSSFLKSTYFTEIWWRTKNWIPDRGYPIGEKDSTKAVFERFSLKLLRQFLDPRVSRRILDLQMP